MKKYTDIAFIVTVFSTVMTSPAHAYLDPGTASLILQSTIGAIAGALVFGKLYLMKIRNFFVRQKPTGGPGDGGTP